MKPACRTCASYAAFRGLDCGSCVDAPPVVVAVNVTEEGVDLGIRAVTTWPEVEGGDWCRRYMERPGLARLQPTATLTDLIEDAAVRQAMGEGDGTLLFPPDQESVWLAVKSGAVRSVHLQSLVYSVERRGPEYREEMALRAALELDRALAKMVEENARLLSLLPPTRPQSM